MDTPDVDELFSTENKQLRKLHEIVAQTIKEEELIINNLLHPPEEVLSRGQKVSDRVARFGGSWTFIIIFIIILVIWILVNVFIPVKDKFDPYPFILMNLLLSCIAALQAPVIMMSQNRKEEKDRQRAENDYMVNLKAELQLRSLHQKIDLLLQEQIKTLYDIQAKQLSLLNEINNKIDLSKNGN
ncbi:MAG TPA: DUF1003 domain-containing protein [Chitinophagaceae bacterium]|jgi:Predicted membrane protein